MAASPFDQPKSRPLPEDQPLPFDPVCGVPVGHGLTCTLSPRHGQLHAAKGCTWAMRDGRCWTKDHKH